MGTRNKTMVIKNKKVIINQYGQWDGYPTCAAATIIDFIKDGGIQKLNQFIPKLERVQIENNCFRFSEMTLSFDQEFKDIQKFIHYDDDGKYSKKFIDRDTSEEAYFSALDIEQQIDLLSNKFGYERASLYIMLTRDTGYRVLDAMSYLSEKFPDKKIPVIIDNYDGWDIEGKNIIDLDKNIFITKYHDKTFVYPFDKLPTVDNLEEIEMLDYDEELDGIFKKLTKKGWLHTSKFNDREAIINFYKLDDGDKYSFHLLRYPKSDLSCSEQFLRQVNELNYFPISESLNNDSKEDDLSEESIQY